MTPTHAIEVWTWADVEEAIRTVADYVRALAPAGRPLTLAGVPRGGLIVAGLLAHALGVEGRGACVAFDPAAPYQPTGRTLVLVDDVCETGATFRTCLAATRASGANVISVALVMKASPTHPVPEGINAWARTYQPGVWVKFPWEVGDPDAVTARGEDAKAVPHA